MTKRIEKNGNGYLKILPTSHERPHDLLRKNDRSAYFGAKFHLESIQKAEKLGLLQITADERVLFPPSDLARILVNIIVYKRLEKLEDTHRQKKMKNESAA